MLSALVWVPVAGAALIAFAPIDLDAEKSRRWSLGIATIILVLTVIIGFSEAVVG